MLNRSGLVHSLAWHHLSQGIDQKTHHHFGPVQAYHRGTASSLLWTWSDSQTSPWYFPKTLTTDCIKCFDKVNKGHVEAMLCSWHFSWSCLAVKIMSFVPLFILNPHWLSGRRPDCSRCSFSRLSRTLARTFLAIDNKEMPRWLSHNWGFTFRLNRWIIDASLNFWGMASFLHIMWNNSVIFFATGVSPAL